MVDRLNVTVVGPAAAGFVAIRPGDATGAPSTSSLNFEAGAVVPNAVQVGLPTTGANAGQIDITYDAYGVAGPSTEMLIDVVGYLIEGGGGATGPTGPPGPKGDTGATGPGYDLAQVVWVAQSGGDYTSLLQALSAIGTTSMPAASATTPYVIKIAPGLYEETTPVAMKDFVDVEGSGQGVTTIECQCVGTFLQPVGVVTAGDITAEIRHLTINNTGGSAASAVLTDGATSRFSILHVTASATGDTNLNFGVWNESSSSPSMNNVTVTATGGATTNYGVYNEASSPTIRGSAITGATSSVRNDGPDTAKIADTNLSGGVVIAALAGTIRCVGVHDQNFVELSTMCT